jgi:hypothetical protein
LAGLDIHETERNLNNRISRGGFTAAFLVAMLGRYWGIVCICLALASGPVFGQQSPNGVSSERPSVEEQGSEQKQPEPFGVPVVVVETSEQSQHADSRESKSDQHEAEDLDAQRKAADAGDRAAAAAEWQIKATVAQIVVAALGTGLLFWTLFLNARAARDAGVAATAGRVAAEASVRAADAAEKAYLADNRPWLNFTLHRVGDYTPGKRLEVYFFLENLGKSPALDTKIWIKAVKVRMIQIDKSHVRKHAEECVRNAPHNTFQSAAVLPTTKMVTRQDAFEVEELESPDRNSTGYWLGLLCVCTYRSAVSDKPDRFFHSTLTLLLKPDTNKGFKIGIPDDLAGTIVSEALDVETITHVASIA